MREIKFRAWDGERLFPYLNVSEYGVGYYEYVDSPDNLKIMQFTGLKDKNGKDIYEGDIVKGKTYLGNMEMFARFIGEVKYYAPNFKLDGVNKYKRCREDLNSSFEVIGNVYENANLFAEVTP